jgi:hypothetical protein
LLHTQITLLVKSLHILADQVVLVLDLGLSQRSNKLLHDYWVLDSSVLDLEPARTGRCGGDDAFSPLAAVGTRGRAKPFGDLGQQPPHDVSGQRVLALLSGILFFILRLAGR